VAPWDKDESNPLDRTTGRDECSTGLAAPWI